jgi:hypothetical protein
VAHFVRILTRTAPLLSLCNWCAWAQSNTVRQWSPWRGDAAFSNIEVRVTCSGYNQFAGLYRWEVELRNNYSQAVDLGWEVDPQTRDRRGRKRRGISRALAADGVEETVEMLPKPCGTEIQVRVVDVSDPERVPQPGTDPASAISPTTKGVLSQVPPKSVVTMKPHEPEPPNVRTTSNDQKPRFKKAIQTVSAWPTVALPQRGSATMLARSSGPPGLAPDGNSDQGLRSADTATSARREDIGRPQQLVCPDSSWKFDQITSPMVRALVEDDRKQGYAQMIDSIGVADFTRITEQMMSGAVLAAERYSTSLAQLSNSADQRSPLSPVPSQSDCEAGGQESVLRCAYYTLQQYILAMEGTLDIVGHCRTTARKPLTGAKRNQRFAMMVTSDAQGY